MAATAPSRPRVLDGDAAPPRFGAGRWLPEGWLRGLISGVEAAVLSWLTVVVPAVAAYVATAAAPALGDASWQAAARTGTALWLLGHGGAMTLAGEDGAEGLVTVAPLGITVLSLFVVYASTRRLRTAHHGVGLVTVTGFLATMLLATFLVPGERAGALLGGAAVALLGTGLALHRAGAPLPGWLSGLAATPAWVRDGLRGGGWALFGLLLLAVAVTGTGLVAGWDRVAMIQEAYLLDPFDLVLMALTQLVLLPTALVWALAWTAGPGFTLGEGTHFAPGEAITAPLPALPLLGALPEPDAPGPPWLVLAPLLAGVLAGVLMHRRRNRSLGEAAGAAGVAAFLTAAVAALLVLLASGSAGPGRLSEAGAQPLLVGGVLLVQVGGASLLTVLALHRRTGELLSSGAVRGWSWARGLFRRG